MSVTVRDRQRRPTLARERLGQIGEAVSARVGGASLRAGVAWVDDREMAELHERFLGRPVTTDVLSFPATEAEDAWGASEPYWGDVVVCTDQAARQAVDLGHPYPFELAVLWLHGLLHLRGYDHTSDGGEMSRLEESLRAPSVRGTGPWT